MSEKTSITVKDNPDRTRFEAVNESGAALIHTEVDDAFEGQGVGSLLARGVLDQARAADRPVDVECSFIKGYVARHQEYQDLLAE